MEINDPPHTQRRVHPARQKAAGVRFTFGSDNTGPNDLRQTRLLHRHDPAIAQLKATTCGRRDPLSLNLQPRSIRIAAFARQTLGRLRGFLDQPLQ